MSLEDLEKEMKGLGPRKDSGKIPSAIKAPTTGPMPGAPIAGAKPIAGYASAPEQAKPAALQRRVSTAAIQPLLEPGTMTPDRTDKLAKIVLLKVKEMRETGQAVLDTPIEAPKGEWEEKKRLWEVAISHVVRGLNQHQVESSVAPGTLPLPRPVIEQEMKERHHHCKTRFTHAEKAHGENKYKAMFDKLDRDHSGTIDAEELKKAMAGLGVELNDRNFGLVMGRVDKDGNGTLDFQEFQELLALLVEVRKMFKDTDVDNSGSVDQQELEDCFSRLGFFKYSPSLLRLFQAMFDYDHSGLIEFQEFFSFVLYYKELDEAYEKKKKTGYAKNLLGPRATPADWKSLEDLVDFKILSVLFKKYLEINDRPRK